MSVDHCHQVQVSLEDLDKQVLRILESITVSQDFLDWTVKWIKIDCGNEAQTQNNILRNLTSRLKSLQNQRDELLKLRISNRIGDEEFTLNRERINQEADEVERNIKDLNQRAKNWMDQMERAFNFARKAKLAFEHGDTKVKMTILQTIGANFALKDKILCVELKKPFMVLADNEEVVKQNLQRIELDDLVLVEAKREDFGEPISKWWTGWDSNPRPIA